MRHRDFWWDILGCYCLFKKKKMKYFLLLMVFVIMSCHMKTAQEYYSLYQQSFKKEDFNKATEYLSLP
jgi:hypothetical protein